MYNKCRNERMGMENELKNGTCMHGHWVALFLYKGGSLSFLSM
jgi:hypothetical protein